MDGSRRVSSSDEFEGHYTRKDMHGPPDGPQDGRGPKEGWSEALDGSLGDGHGSSFLV